MAEPETDTAQREIFEGLFASPPRSEAALRARLAPVEPARGRRILLERLAREGAPPRDSATLVSALGVLGLGEADVPALAALLLDTAAPVSGRAVALALLSALDPVRAQALARGLSPDDLMALNDAQLTAVIASMPTTPARVTEITQKIAHQPPGARGLRLAQLERIRRRLGIPAALLYHDVIGKEELGLEGPLVDLLIEEGGEGAAIRIEELWQASSDEEARARWSAALSRLHQVQGRPAVDVASGVEAWVGVEASGAAVVILSLPSALDGSLTLARAGIAPGSRLEGKVVSLVSHRELDGLLAEVGSVEKAPLADAGARVEAAARGARAPLGLDTFAALCFFALGRRLERKAPPEPVM